MTRLTKLCPLLNHRKKKYVNTTNIKLSPIFYSASVGRRKSLENLKSIVVRSFIVRLEVFCPSKKILKQQEAQISIYGLTGVSYYAP